MRRQQNKYWRAYSSLRKCDILCQKCPGNLVLSILEYTGIFLLYYRLNPVHTRQSHFISVLSHGHDSCTTRVRQISESLDIVTNLPGEAKRTSLMIKRLVCYVTVVSAV